MQPKKKKNSLEERWLRLLIWCKSNCSSASLNFATWYWNTFLNKCDYVVHHFNVHVLLFLLITYYLLFILYLFYTIEMMLDKKQIWMIFHSSSKWVIKQWRQLTTPATHLTQELLMNVEFSGGLRSFASWKDEQTWYVSVSRADWKSKKIIVLKCCLLLFYSTTMNHFLISLWCGAMKTGF